MHNKQGSALLSALFIMTLIAIAATAMSTRLQSDIYQTRLHIASDKLTLASALVNYWAIEQLQSKTVFFTNLDETGKILDFPPKYASLYPDMIIKGELFDLQSRFNINNIQDKKYHLIFSNLIAKPLKKTNTKADAKSIIDAIIHWISPYKPDAGRSLFVAFYMTRKPSYYPGYQTMQHVSELRDVYGVNSALYQSLQPIITALPDITPININTASKIMLKSLGTDLKEAQISEFIRLKDEQGFTNFQKLSPLLTRFNISHEQVTLESNYFLSVADVQEKDLHLIVYSVIKRKKNKKGAILISILSQRLNLA